MIKKIRKYANFLLVGCLKLTKDDKLFIIGNTLINDFLEIVKDEANKIGIKNIEVLNINLEKQKEAYKELSYEEICSTISYSCHCMRTSCLQQRRRWRRGAQHRLAGAGAPFLSDDHAARDGNVPGGLVSGERSGDHPPMDAARPRRGSSPHFRSRPEFGILTP